MGPRPLGKSARQQFAALNAATDADGSQPVGSASSAGHPHGSGGAAGETKRLAVFVSGGGSNMRAIHAATLDGRLPASIEVRSVMAWCAHGLTAVIPAMPHLLQGIPQRHEALALAGRTRHWGATRHQ